MLGVLYGRGQGKKRDMRGEITRPHTSEMGRRTVVHISGQGRGR